MCASVFVVFAVVGAVADVAVLAAVVVGGSIVAK